jgi:hypothetical protein
VGGDSIRSAVELLLQLDNSTKRRLNLGLAGGILCLHTLEQAIHILGVFFEEPIKAGINGGPILLALVKERITIIAEGAEAITHPLLVLWERGERGRRVRS